VPSPEPASPARDAARHPGPESLRAYLDRELGWWARLRCARHLRGCPWCRERLAAEAELEHRAAALLADSAPEVDPLEGWRRLETLAGPAVRLRPLAPLGSPARLAAAGLGVAVIAVTAVLLLRGTTGPGGQAGADARLQDICCWDLDGGGPGDDGVVTVTLPGQQVLGLTVYEDRNGNGALSGEDPIRFASAPVERPHAESAPAAHASATIVRDVCCSDYDRGGPPDDGLVTVSAGGEVLKVLLYEDADGSRTFSSGDPMRWASGTEAK
jgi:hypothetical protein